MPFRPQVSIITNENAHRTVSYDTYRELKKNLKQHLQENLETVVTVSRSRRGEWGEWFENWEMIQGKPKIVTQGWM